MIPAIFKNFYNVRMGILIGVGFWSLTVSADNEFSFSLEESRDFYSNLKIAINDHPEKSLQFALIDQETSQIDIIRSDFGLKSYFEINSKSKPLDSEYDSFFQSIQEKDSTTTDQTIVLEKLLSDFGKTKNKIQEYENLAQAQSHKSANEISRLALNMINSCFDTAFYSLLMNIADISLLRHQEINALIESRVNSGRAAGRELSRSMARVAEAEAKKIMINNGLLAAQSRYKNYFNNEKFCIKFPQITFSILTNKQAIDIAFKENELIQSINFRISAIEKEINAIKRSRFPVIKGQIRSEKTDISNTDDYLLIGGITFNLPIYQGKKTVYEKKKATYKLNAAQFELAAKKLEIQSVIESNLAEINQSKLQEESLLKAFEANSISVEQLNSQFFSANVSLLELLQAERDFMDAAERYLNIAKELRMAQFKHLLYTGRLNTFLQMEF